MNIYLLSQMQLMQIVPLRPTRSFSPVEAQKVSYATYITHCTASHPRCAHMRTQGGLVLSWLHREGSSN